MTGELVPAQLTAVVDSLAQFVEAWDEAVKTAEAPVVGSLRVTIKEVQLWNTLGVYAPSEMGHDKSRPLLFCASTRARRLGWVATASHDTAHAGCVPVHVSQAPLSMRAKCRCPRLPRERPFHVRGGAVVEARVAQLTVLTDATERSQVGTTEPCLASRRRSWCGIPAGRFVSICTS